MTKPQPFVKWVGGKRSLITQIALNLPSNFNHYFEPFLGGGAVYFALENRISKAILSDNNVELITTYQTIKKDPFNLIQKLKEHALNHSKKYYYLIRQTSFKNKVDIAARFLYLNKTCYNGLYRVNNAGKFNVPIGDYKNPNIVQEENILSCHERLKKTEIVCRDFEDIKPLRGDFIYFDPPYHPQNELSFTKYTKEDFTSNDQIRLANYIKKLSDSKIYIMLSNSRTEFVKQLYPKKYFKHKTVNAPRLVNCKSDKRGTIEELLITNF